jgi:hypothetical protein
MAALGVDDSAVKWIAEEKVVFVFPDESRVDGRIALGKPVRVTEEEARCSLAMDGLEVCHPMTGQSTLQALLLAASMLATRLAAFRARGGRLEYRNESHSELPLESYFGGLLPTEV